MKSHAAETAGRPRHLFTARLPDGVVGVEAPADATAPSPALDAARALGASESCWRALEDWLGTGLAPDWIPPADRPAFVEHAVLSHPAAGVDLHLPMSALRRTGSPPPAALAGWQWQPMRCELVLDAVALAPTDLLSLHSGALLLMPAAFASAWHGRLMPMGGPAGVYGAHLYEQRGRLCVGASGQASPHAPNDHATVRFAHPLSVRASHLLGWAGAKPPALDAPHLQLPDALVLHASALAHARPLAAGQLVPVGSGFAMRIDRLFAAETPPAVPSRLEPALPT